MSVDGMLAEQRKAMWQFNKLHVFVLQADPHPVSTMHSPPCPIPILNIWRPLNLLLCL